MISFAPIRGSSGLPSPFAAPTAAPAQRDFPVSIYWLSALLLIHAGLAQIEKGHALLVMLHGAVTLGAALFYGTNVRHPERTIQAVAYICGAEVPWRMCVHSGALPYEFCKYAASVVMSVAILKRRRVSWLPVLYFALLLPSIALTLLAMNLMTAREAVSNSLSGPLVIGASMAFMSRTRLTPQQVCKALYCYIVPITGVAFLCYSGTFGASEIIFGASSNKAASAGFGANQVAASLGFGMLGALFCLLLEKGRLPVKGLLLLLFFWFGVQSGLTFSRTGLYLVAMCACAGVLPLLRNARARWSVLALAVVVFLVAQFALLPMLDHFTGGAFQERFENQSLTHRDELMSEQMRIGFTHPVLGVGPGVIDSENSALEFRAHTEYTRLFAEHGVFGVAALILLFTCVYKGIKQARLPHERALCLAMATFGLMFMVVSSTRLATVGLAFGLATVRIAPEYGRRRKLAPWLIQYPHNVAPGQHSELFKG